MVILVVFVLNQVNSQMERTVVFVVEFGLDQVESVMERTVVSLIMATKQLEEATQ